MKREDYERTEMVITEFDSDNVITTSALNINRDEYEQTALD